jgi:hypothetical protein
MLFNCGMGLHSTFGGAGRLSQATIQNIVARGLPGAEIGVHVLSSDEMCIDVTCRAGRNLLFSARDNIVQTGAGILAIAQDRDSEVRTHLKGAGFGKVFLDNMLTLAREMNLQRITLRAGREDGAWYWSYRGARLDAGDTDGMIYKRFESTVRDNIARIGDNGLRAQVEEILARPGLDANVRIARIGTMDAGRPAGALVLAGTNPPVVFNMNDAA